MITKFKKFFEKENEKKSPDSSNVVEKLTALKKITKNPVKSDFLGDFSLIKKAVNTEVSVKEQNPMIMNSRNQKLLKESIVISLEFPVERYDLQFIGNSIINGKPIYRYIGQNFSTFNIPYEECISIK